jgi:hypothetical protein
MNLGQLQKKKILCTSSKSQQKPSKQNSCQNRPKSGEKKQTVTSLLERLNFYKKLIDTKNQEINKQKHTIKKLKNCALVTGVTPTGVMETSESTIGAAI